MCIRDSYWKEGGQIQWFAQVCIERGDPDLIAVDVDLFDEHVDAVLA